MGEPVSPLFLGLEPSYPPPSPHRTALLHSGGHDPANPVPGAKSLTPFRVSASRQSEHLPCAGFWDKSFPQWEGVLLLLLLSLLLLLLLLLLFYCSLRIGTRGPERPSHLLSSSGREGREQGLGPTLPAPRRLCASSSLSLTLKDN